jgi:hypothetical protein
MFRSIWVGLAALLMAAAGGVSAAAPASAGLVLDVQGKGEIVQQGARGKLQLLDYLQPGATLTLDAGSKASISHYGAKMIYRLVGPVQVQVEADRLRHVSGTAPVTMSLAEKTVSAALNPNLGPAAYKMRELPQITVLSPASGGSILGTRPQFRWKSGEPVSYQIDLTELPGRQVARAKVDGQVWDLPPGVELVHGKSYRWTVSSIPEAGGKVRTANATFNLPARADAELLAALAPKADAPIDEWVMYASILKEWNMLDEARGAWRHIATQRPDLAPAY